MATFDTPWYQIDTEDFETEADVKEMIRNISEEAFALCRGCSKHDACNEEANIPEDHPGCARREDYRGLAAVIGALFPYCAALAARNVA